MGCGSSAARYTVERKQLDTASPADCTQELEVDVKRIVNKDSPHSPPHTPSTDSQLSSSDWSSSHELIDDRFEESCLEQSKGNPKFEFVPGALSEEEIHGIQTFADQHLGLDESSVYFMRRKKAIAFVFVLHGRVYSMEQNYFVQHESYNDFSGGIRRPFAKISDSCLQNELNAVVLRFVEYNKIPDKAIMLIQIQTSEVDRSEEGEFRRQLSITGQGIHTDGHEKAMLVCIRRKNVTGAMNQYYADLNGKQPLCEPRILQEGDASFFTDNELYHYVSPAGPADPTEDMARTMLLMHYPAEEVLVGAPSSRNNQGARASNVKLRETHQNSCPGLIENPHVERWDALSYPKL